MDIQIGLGFLAIVMMLPWAGCKKDTAELDAMERRLPRMEEAKRRERSGDIDGAVELYRDVLAENPNLAKAHLELGLLVDDRYQDDVTAIYHYRRYLELRPDTEKRAMLEQLIQFAEFSFATSITNHPAAVVGEMTRLNEQIAGLEKDLDAARKQITGLKRSLAEAKMRPATSGQTASGQTASPVETISIAPEPRTYRVQRGDTLSRIAQKVYKDSSKWKKIYEANQESMKSSSDLDVGQVLIIP